jgi:hypothetical protein
MSNLRKALESQQKMNEAVNTVADYFRDTSYETELELILSATTQIVGLMELAKQRMINTRGRDELEFKTDEISLFLRVVNEYLKMLKPFAEMMEGKEDDR